MDQKIAAEKSGGVQMLIDDLRTKVFTSRRLANDVKDLLDQLEKIFVAEESPEDKENKLKAANEEKRKLQNDIAAMVRGISWIIESILIISPDANLRGRLERLIEVFRYPKLEDEMTYRTPENILKLVG